MNYSMTWADFYLICFAVGFCFSFFSFVFGGARTGRLHLPHFPATLAERIYLQRAPLQRTGQRLRVMRLSLQRLAPTTQV
jgi:hypothetical protein